MPEWRNRCPGRLVFRLRGMGRKKLSADRTFDPSLYLLVRNFHGVSTGADDIRGHECRLNCCRFVGAVSSQRRLKLPECESVSSKRSRRCVLSFMTTLKKRNLVLERSDDDWLQ